MSGFPAMMLGIVLLVGNAFFVGAEFALISARRSQIEPKAKAGHRMATITLKSMESVSQMMAGAQLGITVCSLGLGAVAEPALAAAIEPAFEAIGVPSALVHPIAFAIALSIVVYLHMVLGEMVPKNVALAGPERSALILGPPLWLIVTVLKPVIWLLNAIANVVLRVLRVQPKDEVSATFTREEVAGLIAESRREGLLEDEEAELMSGALELVETTAADLTLADDVLSAVRADDDISEVRQRVLDTGYSRFPVLADDGRPIGYIHIKDVLPVGGRQPTGLVGDQTLRDLPRVPPHAPAIEVAQRLGRAGAHLAQVRTADGDFRGILALEDVLEELIGEVRDVSHQSHG